MYTRNMNKISSYRVQAQNPSGTNYDVQANTLNGVKVLIRDILARGGTGVTVNEMSIVKEAV